MRFDVGSIVRARGREWVVLPNSTAELVHAEPLGGAPEERTAFLTSIEPVESATFPLPNPAAAGDASSARLLLDAARLSNRNTTGPFRSLGRIAITPRPYQLVPLLLALRRETVRILIADDVGVGKTVESLLIARELLDRAEVDRFSILCPPHLVDQWVRELSEKFHLDAVAYTAATAPRLTRDLLAGETVFDRHAVVVASIDYVKQTTRRDYFLQHAPKLIIVDEAHTCAKDPARSDQHLRNFIVERLSQDRDRHLVLVTATPHTGKEDAFRNLIGFLNPEFTDPNFPTDLRGEHNRRHRERLAEFMVQRRRKDLATYLEKTPFPQREVKEVSYPVHDDVRRIIDEVLDHYRSEYKKSGDRRGQRVVYWTLLSLLRSIASSPAAAIATLTRSSIVKAARDDDEADRIGEQSTLDDPDDAQPADEVAGARLTDDPLYDVWTQQLERLAGAKDVKLRSAAAQIQQLVADKYNVIVFCQFIPTAKYLADELAKLLPNVHVTAVTGELNPHDREERIRGTLAHDRRVLVATDCMSEGINLQNGYSAVYHYDLSWNPTRHEQREGRVDRYGQEKDPVRMVTYYGKGNIIDGLILRVLLRKHESIRSSTGVSVPVPSRAKDVMEAIEEALLLKGKDTHLDADQLDLRDFGLDDVHVEWEQAAEREKGSPTLFAQRQIKDEEVQRELAASRDAMGNQATTERFVLSALERLGAGIAPHRDHLAVVTQSMNPEARDALRLSGDSRITFKDEAEPGVLKLHRTHPFVEGLADYVLESSLDDLLKGVAARCGAIRTGTVSQPTTLLVTRYRYQITLKGDPRLVEETRLYAFEGPSSTPRWLTDGQTEALLQARPDQNIDGPTKQTLLKEGVAAAALLKPTLHRLGEARKEEILNAHKRVRTLADLRLGRISLELQGDPEILGLYLYVPVAGGR